MLRVLNRLLGAALIGFTGCMVSLIGLAITAVILAFWVLCNAEAQLPVQLAAALLAFVVLGSLVALAYRRFAPRAATSSPAVAAIPRQSHRPRGNTTKGSTGARATALALLRTTTHALTGLLRRQPSTAPAPAKRHVAVPGARQAAAAAQFVSDEPLAPSADPQYPGTTPIPTGGLFVPNVDPRATTSSH